MWSGETIGSVGAMICLVTLFLALGAAAGCDGVVGGGSGGAIGEDTATPEDVGPEIVPVPGTPAEFAEMVEQELWWEDLVFIAQPREPGSPHWQAVQDLCRERFEDLGYTTTLHEYETGVNVIGIKEGLATPDEWVVVSGHYDHIPGCPGADDNATAVAGVLELARVLAPGSFDRTIVLACWDEEEIGLRGAGAWVADQAEADRDIVASLVFEMIGYTCDEPECQRMPLGFDLMFPEQGGEFLAGDQTGDFVAFIADWRSADSAAALVEHSDEIGLPNMHFEMSDELMGSPMLLDLFRSDHAAFWYHEYPGIMITDSSEFRNPNYHCPDEDHMDTVDTIDAAFGTEVTRVTAYAAAAMAGVQ